MDGFSLNLLLAAAGIAFFHTVLGPDHYLPFLMLARARGWSRSRTLAVTLACGAGHVLSSLLLGGVGLGLGLAVARIEHVEGIRGDWAAWGLVLFGSAYALWGARRVLRRSQGLAPHTHRSHVHIHRHGASDHDHDLEPASAETRGEERTAITRGTVTFWTLFAVFVLGPCEPLIPLFVLPASRGRWAIAATTALLFGAVTVVTMTAITLAGLAGLRHLSLRGLERWAHAMAGVVIAASGGAVLALGL